ncbi:MAG: ABC-F family ATP-binding cassette domain-containing protein [Gemmatimonadales bacterium]
MSLLTLGDVAVTFGATTILDGVTWTVSPGDRWGIVGRNGAGKTTIFRLVTGDLMPTRGTVSRQGGLRVAMLDQHRDFGGATTVWEAAAQGFAELMRLEKRLAADGGRIAALGNAVTERDLDRYGRLQEQFVHAGGYDFHARVDAVLQGLGFDPVEAQTRPVGALSGGERGRIGLAGPLASPADLLLLDEPTNHLDLDTTRWLAAWLATLNETVLVISHDRAFLDEAMDHTLHVHARTAVPYRGGYSYFVHQRAERELSQRRAVEKQAAHIAKEEEYIRRHIAGQNSAQAKGRRKRLARLERLSPPPGSPDAMSLRLEIFDRGGDRVIQMEKMEVKAGERTLLKDVTATLHRGDIVALVGPNGAGKSTLLQTMLESNTLGASIRAAWYRQDLAGVPLDKAIYQVIEELRPRWSRGQIQGHLGAFGFSGQEVERKTTTLSGGERARVALAMITLQRANLLVLDEPTNHLDVESIEALEDALEEYEGSVLLVSHDRAFLRELVTRVWSINDGKLEVFDGTFVEWESWRENRETGDGRRQDGKAVKRTPPKAKSPKPDRSAQVAIEAAVQAAEGRVAALEAALADTALYDGSAENARKAGQLKKELEGAKAELDRAMEAWV